jgi:dihydroorotase-like cyclic amidohydrolase
MSPPDVHGPIDTLVIEFPDGATGEATARALHDLVDTGAVRLFDLMVVGRDADGLCVEIDPADDRLRSLQAFSGARSGMLDADDLPELATVLEANRPAVVLVYENAWAVPFVAAARAEGAELVASSRLSAQQILDALDSVEAIA